MRPIPLTATVQAGQTCVRAQELRMRNWRKTVDEITANGGFIIPYVIELGDEFKRKELRYTTVSNEAMVDLITEQITLDPNIKIDKPNELKLLVIAKIRLLQKQTRFILKDLKERKLPVGKLELKDGKELVTSLDKQLAALPPAGEPPAGLKAIRESMGTTVTYREAGKKRKGSFSIGFTFEDDE